MTGSFGGFLERIFHLFFFCWCQPSTPQPSPNRPIGLHIRNATAKIKKWHFESKNGIFNIKHKYWHGYQVFQVGMWTGVLMFNVKNPILDMKCHFFNFSQGLWMLFLLQKTVHYPLFRFRSSRFEERTNEFR